MKKIFLFCFIAFIGISLYSQTPKTYASKIIEKLTSEEMEGRGYVDNGMGKAADFLAEEYKKIGLLPLQDSYFQTFTYPVNIIKTSKLSVNGKKLKFDEDYLVGAGSPSITGKFTPHIFNTKVVDSIYVDSNNKALEKELDLMEGKAVVFPTVVFPQHYVTNAGTALQFYNSIPESIIDESMEINIPLVIQQTTAKLTHTVSGKQTKTASIFLKEEAVSDKISDIDVDIKSEFNPNFEAKNVVGMIKGERSDSLIVVTCHYDHLGKINEVIFPGANDNASGTSFVLTLAKLYSKEKPKFDMVFIAFAGEEAGLKGSFYFVNHPLIDLKKVKFLFNFDMVGTGEEGFSVINGKQFKKEFDRLETINYNLAYFKDITPGGNSCNSDHCPFYQKGVPSFFIFTKGGSKAYHDKNDQLNQLSLFGFDKLVSLFNKFIDTF